MTEQEEQPAKKKRTTIADLKKDLQEVEQLIDENILDELAAHEVRIEKIEAGSLSNREDVAADIAARLSALEKGTTILQGNQSTLTNQYIEQQKRLDEEKPDGAVTNVTDRLTALENAAGALADAIREIVAGTADWELWREDAKDLIHSMQAAITDMQENAGAPGLDFVVRKTPETNDRLHSHELKAIAQIAQTMNDVLMLTRVLKADKNFSDDERREIMSIACKAAGVPYAENLLTRAGVKHFSA